MRKPFFAAAMTVFALGHISSGQADERCNVSMVDWQPREALHQKLHDDGWQVQRIKTDDGCYKAYLINDKGENIKAYFNPKTLLVIKKEDKD